MDAARLNFSHGTYSHHSMLVSNIRKAAKNQEKPIAIIQDLQGARVRVGNVSKDGVAVSMGEVIILADEKKIKKIGARQKTSRGKIKRIIPITYPALTKTIKKGHRIFIDDKSIELAVKKVRVNYIECEAVRDGIIKTHKGINLPDSEVALPTITAKDKQDIEFGIKQGVDFIALSFVRSAGDVRQLRRLIKKYAGVKEAVKYKIIVKIERPEAVEHFDKILKETDAVMVARGDLGIELPPEDVPIIQKDIVAKCLKQAKPVIVATQMLESMINNLNPTRAEVSDVANAVIDHADAVMLSGETANGKYPAETVEMMKKIISKTERSAYDDLVINEIKAETGRSNLAIGTAVSVLAESEGIKSILAISLSSDTARAISRFRPEIPIIAATEHIETRQHLMLSWGVFPILIYPFKNISVLVKNLIDFIKDNGIVSKGDKVLVLIGDSYCEEKGINSIKILQA